MTSHDAIRKLARIIDGLALIDSKDARTEELVSIATARFADEPAGDMYTCPRCGQQHKRTPPTMLDDAADEVPEVPPLACLDCGLPYSRFPLDVNLPRAQWLAIHPDEHGLLCAQCIVTRGSRLAGVTVAHMVFEVMLPAAAPEGDAGPSTDDRQGVGFATSARPAGDEVPEGRLREMAEAYFGNWPHLVGQAAKLAREAWTMGRGSP